MVSHKRRCKYKSNRGNNSHWSGAYLSQRGCRTSYELSKGDAVMRFSWFELHYLKEEIERVFEKPNLKIPQDIDIEYDLIELMREAISEINEVDFLSRESGEEESKEGQK